MLSTFPNLLFNLEIGVLICPLTFKSLLWTSPPREIFKTLSSRSSNSPFSLSLVTSLMPWLKSLSFIDFSFPVTSTSATVGFYERSLIIFCSSQKLCPAQVGVSVGVNVSLFIRDGIMLFCITKIPSPVTTADSIMSSGMSKISIYSREKRPNCQRRRDEFHIQ